MSEWKEYKLGEVINLKRGYDLPNSKREDGPYLIVSSSGITGYHSQYMKEPPGVVTGRYGTIGKLFYINEPYWPLNTTLYVTDFKGNFPKFIYYFLQSFDFEKFSDKSTVPGINRNHLHAEDIILPPLPEQKTIASILSSLDDKIDLLHRQNATLEKMAETLFRQWFVEEAKEEWEMGKLSDFGKIITGKTPNTKIPELWGESFQFITPTDYKNFSTFSIISERNLSSEGWKRSKGIQLPPNAIMVTCIGSDMGKICISYDRCITNQQINSLILNYENDLGYIYNYLKSQYQTLRNIALGGTTMPIINKTDFSNIEIPKPDRFALNEFNNYWIDWSKKIKINQTQIRTLTTLRDTLLPKLMSGEIRVKTKT